MKKTKTISLQVKLIPGKLKSQLPTSFFDDKAVLSQGMYEKLFRKSFSSQGNKPWKRGVLKVIYKNRKKRTTIIRMFVSQSSFKISSKQVGLTKLSQHILQLPTRLTTKHTVEVCLGNKIRFYWEHPDHVTRVAIKIALISILITTLAAIISILTIL